MNYPLSRARFRSFVSVVCIAAWLLVGCTSQPTRDERLTTAKTFDPDSVQYVRNLAQPHGFSSQVVQGVALVVGLPGTGSDPKPSMERSILQAEMRSRGVERSGEVLASPGTALALVRGFLPPGAKRGDRFDLEVRVPAGSDTVSLQGGRVMMTRLREYVELKGRLSTGHIVAAAEGDVLVDSLIEGDTDPVLRTRGVVLGGGIVRTPRNLGLMIRDDFTSVRTSTRIGKAINDRFNMYDRGEKRGVAIPKRDNYIELSVHPRYHDNIIRYVRVVESIAVRESASDVARRLEQLREALQKPAEAALAALHLEAIGDDGIPLLEEALAWDNLEIGFYAAESLAYQDQPSAVDTLVRAIQEEPAFRLRALMALGVMDNIESHEALIGLLSSDSAETRYGAFRTLRRLAPNDPMIQGDVINDRFLLHRVSSNGPPLVHVTREERPEIVLFGTDHTLQEPIVVFAGSDIVIRGAPQGRLVVRRLTAGEEDREMEVSRQLSDVILAIAELDGSYPEVVQAIHEAKRTGALASRLEFSAIPSVNRTYRRETSDTTGFELSDGAPPDDKATTAATDDSQSTDSGEELFPSADEIDTAAEMLNYIPSEFDSPK